MATFLATLLLDVDLGLAIGVLYSLLTFAFRLQYGKVSVLGRVKDNKEVTKSSKKDPLICTFSRKQWKLQNLFCFQAYEISDTKIFRLSAPLYSGNAEKFICTVRQAIAVRETGHTMAVETIGQQSDVYQIPAQSFQMQQKPQNIEDILRTIIIDCAGMNFIDIVGADQLKKLARECNKKQIQLILASCSGKMTR